MIEYAGVSFCGLVRENNEDNLYFNGKYLEQVHGDSPVYTGFSNNPILAVFDGMGGEQDGEAALFLAARCLSEDRGQDPDIIREMNKKVCEYIDEKKLEFSGSTLAMVNFKPDSVECANVGDSRIYLLRDGRLRKVSRDHTTEVMGQRRLTQCLGIPEENFVIEPFVTSHTCQSRDRWLICSDGVIDMLSDEELEEIMNKSGDCTSKVHEISKAVLEKGARDNTTFIHILARRPLSSTGRG